VLVGARCDIALLYVSARKVILRRRWGFVSSKNLVKRLVDESSGNMFLNLVMLLFHSVLKKKITRWH
jgi:uncharacterized Fe-S cluster-containing radical SAM superfamily protein